MMRRVMTATYTGNCGCRAPQQRQHQLMSSLCWTMPVASSLKLTMHAVCMFHFNQKNLCTAQLSAHLQRV
jgi:hypothetical protein